MTCALCGNSTRGYLCTWHQGKLAAGLRELPTLYTEVAECLVPRRSSWGEIVTTRRAAGPRSPIDEDILDTVNWNRAAEVMRLWRTDIRRVRWPHRGAPPLGSLAEDCAWLLRELDWIVANYPAVGDLANETRALELQARSVVGDPPPRPKEIGRCIAAADAEGAVCGTVLTHTAGQSSVTCGTCRTVYSSERDLLLLLHCQPEPA